MVLDENGNGNENDGNGNILADFSSIDEECKTQNGSVKEGVDGEDGKSRLDGGTLGRQLDEILSDEKLTTVTSEGKEEGNEKEEEMDDQESKFSVGDFVWGKIKSHPWWPGQIHNPSDASDYAAMYHREGRLLVAYFGDRTFAWCNPSQLRTFVDNFEQMSKQSNSKSFINAVEDALDEFGRCVELELTCSCVQIQPSFARSFSVNAGLKEGVSIPKGGVGEVFSINGFEPMKFLMGLRDTAQVVCISSLLELTVFQSRLSAFYRTKGYGQLPTYHQHKGITDHEDNDETKLSEKAEIDDEMGDLTQSPAEDDWHSSPTGPWTRKNSLRSSQKRPPLSFEKLYQRKKRSMAELMAESIDSEHGNDDFTTENGSDMVEESKVNCKSALPSRKHRKTKHSESPSSKAENKTLNIQNEEDGVKEETVIGQTVLSPRIRKKSKYLSPPYTMLGVHRSFSSKDADKETPKNTNDSRDRECISLKNSETEVPKVPKVYRVGECISKIAGQLTGSPPTIKCSSETFHKKVAKEARTGHNISDRLSPRTPKANQKTLVLIEDGASADEILSKFRSAALDPFYLKKKRRSSDVTLGFFARFRSSLYRDGSNFETYKKYLTDSNGKKRKKPLDAKRSSSVKFFHKTDPSEVKPVRKKRKRKEEATDTNHKKAKGETLAALLLTFAPGFALPSKDDLIKVFGQFGVLNEYETEVMKDSGCAQVVFQKNSDAEEAFNSSDKIVDFGSGVLSYRLRFPSGCSRALESDGNVRLADTEAPPSSSQVPAEAPLLFIQKNLEMMASMLNKSPDKLSPEARANLEGEIRGLLKKVNKMVESSA